MLQVSLYRLDQLVYEGPAFQVVLPGEAGELAVWPFHAPMLCALSAGAVLVDEKPFAIRGGLARVLANHVTILGE